jgi:hypothetical protein
MLSGRTPLVFDSDLGVMTIGTSDVRVYQPPMIADLGYTDIASAQLLNLPISIMPSWSWSHGPFRISWSLAPPAISTYIPRHHTHYI